MRAKARPIPFPRYIILAVFLLASSILIMWNSMRRRSVSLSAFSEQYLSHLPKTPDYLTEPLSIQRENREKAAMALVSLGEFPEMAMVEDIESKGSRPLMRKFIPLGADERSPVLLYIHGGGWVLSSVRTHDGVCRQLAEASKAIVLSVEYRLSPEVVFPAALDDCLEAYLYALTLDGGSRLGVVLVGDSAGGNLAAGLAHRLRDERARIPPLASVLIYPALDARCNSRSMEQFETSYGLSREAMKYFWKAYLGRNGDERNNSPYASPLEDTNFAGLPPAFIAVAEADVLRDDGLEYAIRLKDAGGTAEVYEAKGELHGFIKHTKNPASAPFIKMVAERGVALALREVARRAAAS